MILIEIFFVDFWWNIYFNDVSVFFSNELKLLNVVEKFIIFVEYLKFFFYLLVWVCVGIFFNLWFFFVLLFGGGYKCIL